MFNLYSYNTLLKSQYSYNLHEISFLSYMMFLNFKVQFFIFCHRGTLLRPLSLSLLVVWVTLVSSEFFFFHGGMVVHRCRAVCLSSGCQQCVTKLMTNLCCSRFFAQWDRISEKGQKRKTFWPQEICSKIQVGDEILNFDRFSRQF